MRILGSFPDTGRLPGHDDGIDGWSGNKNILIHEYDNFLKN